MYSACLKHTASNRVQNTSYCDTTFQFFVHTSKASHNHSVMNISQFSLTNQLQFRLDLQAGFDLTLGFNTNWKKHDPDCKFPPKVQPGSF